MYMDPALSAAWALTVTCVYACASSRAPWVGLRRVLWLLGLDALL
jgi:hypothetical protein